LGEWRPQHIPISYFLPYALAGRPRALRPCSRNIAGTQPLKACQGQGRRALHELPLIMVALNGASRTKADHPMLPVTVDDIVRDAAACYEAGAGVVHLH